MSGNSSEDYKELFEQEKRRREQEQRRREQEQRRREQEQRRREQEQRRREQAEDRRRQAEDRQRQAEDRQRQAEDDARREKERNQKTTFVEFLQQCHTLLSLPLTVETPSRSTTGSIPLPTGKYCPTRLELWEDCPSYQQEVYNSVYHYLQPANADAPRLFSSRIELEGLSRRIENQAISSEQELEFYERSAVDHHVGDIISELCKIPAARNELRLGDGVRFCNHTNSLEQTDYTDAAASQPSSIHRPRPDDFCIHVVDNNTNALLTSGEYKPPHKLPTRTIRLGLRPMNLWDHMVRSKTTPTDEAEKLKYNAERLVCSAIVQQYHVMIQDGLEVAYLTNGFCDVHLRIPHDNPNTLQYYLCDPNAEVGREDHDMLEPKTAIARRLCLYLMGCRHPIRSQEWRNAAREQLRIWHTSFNHVRAQIPKAELNDTLLHSDSTEANHACRTPSDTQQQRSESPDSPDSPGADANPATARRKRDFSQVTSSPSAQPAPRPRNIPDNRGNQPRQHDAKFCTLRCLLGLQNRDALDDKCPNVELHRQDKKDTRHSVSAEGLVHSLKEQLDRDLDRNCTPFGHCGGSGAPFKLTCATYGYTVVGKGTTTDWWTEVAREADAYRILRKAQASAVPVFLGTINLSKVYFLHGAGEIRHMLIMGWGGASPKEIEPGSKLRKEIKRSVAEIHGLGVIHQDLRRENILWNAELRRALIIDFHHSKFVLQRPAKRSQRANGPLGRLRDRSDTRQAKRLRVV
ncbi:serine/threonine protein kinase domain protein [Metarhizium robertsii]|uniref:Serine/threonine protein kinase domain protein n=1 Tax=Metarhizium robertsii TaxID=568076 RepID=A0A014PFV8_9HYPO|nr:serine/threonine protein kinase domain protein [Metarhizium robertsii]